MWGFSSRLKDVEENVSRDYDLALVQDVRITKLEERVEKLEEVKANLGFAKGVAHDLAEAHKRIRKLEDNLFADKQEGSTTEIAEATGQYMKKRVWATVEKLSEEYQRDVTAIEVYSRVFQDLTDKHTMPIIQSGQVEFILQKLVKEGMLVQRGGSYTPSVIGQEKKEQNQSTDKDKEKYIEEAFLHRCQQIAPAYIAASTFIAERNFVMNPILVSKVISKLRTEGKLISAVHTPDEKVFALSSSYLNHLNTTTKPELPFDPGKWANTKRPLCDAVEDPAQWTWTWLPESPVENDRGTLGYHTLPIPVYTRLEVSRWFATSGEAKAKLVIAAQKAYENGWRPK